MKRGSAVLLAMTLGAGLPAIADAQGVPVERGGRFDPSGQPDRVPAPDRPEDPRRPGAGFDGRPDDRRFGDGRGYDAPRGDDRRRWAGNGPGGRDWDGRDQARRDDARWNGRGWRQDGRYDWRDYRDVNRDRFRPGRYAPPRGGAYAYRRFGIGATVPGPFLSRTYWLADPHAYHLPPAGGAYRWVRYYDDVLLMDLRNGRVVDTVPGFFW